MRRLFITLFALLAILFAPVALAAADPPLTITMVRGASHQQTAGWDVTLSNGVTLFCPIRPFIDGGRAPATGGTLSNFVDQGSFLGWYYGFATFSEGGVNYHGYRR